MKIQNYRRLVLAASALAAVCLVGVTCAPGAEAEVAVPLASTTHPWSLSAVATGANPGSMESHGTLAFESAHEIAYEGSVNDICPADGKGAMVRVLLRFANSTQKEITLMTDDTGCGTAGITNTSTITKPKKKIAYASVELYEETGGVPGTMLDYTNFWNNPYV